MVGQPSAPASPTPNYEGSQWPDEDHAGEVVLQLRRMQEFGVRR